MSVDEIHLYNTREEYDAFVTSKKGSAEFFESDTPLDEEFPVIAIGAYDSRRCPRGCCSDNWYEVESYSLFGLILDWPVVAAVLARKDKGYSLSEEQAGDETLVKLRQMFGDVSALLLRPEVSSVARDYARAHLSSLILEIEDDLPEKESGC